MRCVECEAPLAPDQRYCVECGARRGAPPRAIARHVQAIRAGRAALDGEPVAAQPASAPTTTEDGVEQAGEGLTLWPAGWPMPRPQAVAVAVMALLAFGVIVGSTVRPPAPSSPGVLLADMPPTQTAPAAAAVPAPAQPESTPEPSSAASTAEPAESPSGATSATGATGPAKSKAPGGEGATPPAGNGLPPIKHVFMIVLSEHGYDEAFGAASAATYLSKTLASGGEVLRNYYAVAPSELANEIALDQWSRAHGSDRRRLPDVRRHRPEHARRRRTGARQRLRVSIADADDRQSADRGSQDLEGLCGGCRKRRAGRSRRAAATRRSERATPTMKRSRVTPTSRGAIPSSTSIR